MSTSHPLCTGGLLTEGCLYSRYLLEQLKEGVSCWVPFTLLAELTLRPARPFRYLLQRWCIRLCCASMQHTSNASLRETVETVYIHANPKSRPWWLRKGFNSPLLLTSGTVWQVSQVQDQKTAVGCIAIQSMKDHRVEVKTQCAHCMPGDTESHARLLRRQAPGLSQNDAVHGRSIRSATQ